MKESHSQYTISFTSDYWKPKIYIAIRLPDQHELERFIDEMKNYYNCRM